MCIAPYTWRSKGLPGVFSSMRDSVLTAASPTFYLYSTRLLLNNPGISSMPVVSGTKPVLQKKNGVGWGDYLDHGMQLGKSKLT